MAGSTFPEPDWGRLFQDRALRKHLFSGTVRKVGGKTLVSGLHHLHRGVVPEGKAVTRTSPVWENGGWAAEISMRARDGRMYRKRSPTSMFPDEWSQDQVLGAGRDALRQAWEQDAIGEGGGWAGQVSANWRGARRDYDVGGFVTMTDGRIGRLRTFFLTERTGGPPDPGDAVEL